MHNQGNEILRRIGKYEVVLRRDHLTQPRKISIIQATILSMDRLRNDKNVFAGARKHNMRNSIATRIREARLQKHMDQARLAAKIDVATRTVQRWEKGEQVPDSNYLMRISKATGVTPHWLLTGGGEMYFQPGEAKVIPLPTSRYRKVELTSLPLLSSVPGGIPSLMFHPDHVEKYITVDDVHDSNAFALEVRGNSMAPKIEDGDIIVVSPKMEPRSGDICVVRVNEEDTVKRIKIEDQFLHLIPLNPEYEPIAIRKRDVSFMWKVIKVIKNL
jgi:repressor LexA